MPEVYAVWWAAKQLKHDRYIFAAFIGAALVLALSSLIPWATAEREVPLAPKRTIPDTDVNPFGANFFLPREVEDWKRERTVSMAAEAGIRWAKIQFAWAEMERNAKARTPEELDFAKYDAIVDLCLRYGLRVIARLDRAPDWSRADDSVPGSPPDNFQDYADFVYAFAKHYQGRVDYIQIWNEPNLWQEWGNRPVDPAGYVELLRLAYIRAKEANPNVHILSAPLAITLWEPHPEPGRWSAMNDLQYLEEMYKAGAAAYFDILSANAFGMDLPPEDAPSPNKLNFSRVLLQRQIMERFGDANKAIWLNEFGWNAAPPDFPPEKLIWKRVSEEQQAEYSLRAIEMARSRWPWIGVFSFWYFRQVGDIPADRADYYFRIVDVDFTPRRLYYAIKDATASLAVAQPGYHEETSPGAEWGPGWRQEISSEASGRGVVVSDRPGSTLTLTFKGSGVSLIAIEDSRSGALLVTLDGRRVPGLPVDEEGNSFVDLYSPERRFQAPIPIVQGLGEGQHTLRLTVAPKANPSSRGNRCAVDAFVVAPPQPPPFPLWQLGAAAALLAGGIYGLRAGPGRFRA